ncbi:metallophosphoesterase [bacterium]|nr:metallophosphoesterase [bacterium]
MIWTFTFLGLLISLSHPRIVEIKALGVLLNAPGMMLLGSVFGYSLARTFWGRVLSWLLTVAMLEPLRRWIRVAPKPGRRAVLLGGGVAMGGLAVGGYGSLYERKHFVLEQFALSLPDLPLELEGLRVVLMADWHCGPSCRPDDLFPAIQLANSCRPDLVLLPGDFVSRSSRYFHEAAELASQLRPTLPGGLLVSWGNHDHWEGLDIGRAELQRAGCQILTNRSLLLKPDRSLDSQGSRGLWLCGLDDLWAGHPDLLGTLAPLSNCPRLVMSHNPDLAEEQAGPRVDLMLSGHTHGGQIWVPTLGTPVLPSRYGQKYASGWVEGPHYPVYVTRGVGTSASLPVRLGVPPEVTLFVLRRGARGLVRV